MLALSILKRQLVQLCRGFVLRIVIHYPRKHPVYETMQNTSANKVGLVSAVLYIHIVNYRDAFDLVRLIFFADRVMNILTQVGFPEDDMKPYSVLVFVFFFWELPFKNLSSGFFLV